jgi:Sec-independent protein secretion pathway component TatC
MLTLSFKTKGILTIVSGLLIHLVLGSVYSYTLFSPYLLSYLHSFDDSIVLDDGFWFTPIAIVISTFSIAFGGYLEGKLGPRM